MSLARTVTLMLTTSRGENPSQNLSGVCFFSLGYAEIAKGYRVFDSERAKAKLCDRNGSMSIKYTTHSPQQDTVTHLIKKGDETVKVDRRKQEAKKLHEKALRC